MRETVRTNLLGCGLLVLSIGAGLPGVAHGDDLPQVEFDISPVVACRLAESADGSALPGMKVIEARFRVSVQLRHGEERQLAELLFEVSSPARRMRVVDFSPITELASAVEGTIETKRTSESVRTLGLGISGTAALPQAAVTGHLSPSANIGTTKRDVNTQTVHKLPEKQAIVVSGTTDGGHGVFFKLRRFSQTSLEGAHELTCRFAVPEAWRGDWLELSASATARTKSLFGERIESAGRARWTVGLHAADDVEARRAARALADAQRVWAGESKHAGKSSDKFAAVIDEAKAPFLPASWSRGLSALVGDAKKCCTAANRKPRQPTDQQAFAPRAIRLAEARLELARLAGGSSSVEANAAAKLPPVGD